MALNLLIILACVVSLTGFFVSPMILLSLFQLVPTAMFAMRRIGVITPFSKVRNTEITGDVLILILGWVTHKLSWMLLVVLVLRVIFLLLVWYDDKHYLYVEEDM